MFRSHVEDGKVFEEVLLVALHGGAGVALRGVLGPVVGEDDVLAVQDRGVLHRVRVDVSLKE